MGYWVCPRCGSNDAYMGTEVVAGSTGNAMATEDGFVSQSRLTTKNVEVFKCRDCGEILNKEKNWLLTSEEQKFLREKERIAEEKRVSVWRFLWNWRNWWKWGIPSIIAIILLPEWLGPIVAGVFFTIALIASQKFE